MNYLPHQEYNFSVPDHSEDSENWLKGKTIKILQKNRGKFCAMEDLEVIILEIYT